LNGLARPFVSTARHAAAALALVLVAATPDTAASGEPSAAWASIGLLGGSTLPDAKLADYQWDTRPRTAWGAQALAGVGRFAVGARAWRSQTVQVLDLPAGPLSPEVRSTTLEVLGRVRLASLAGTGISLAGSAGRLGIRYRPGRVVISSGPGGDVSADLAPLSEWTVGAGIAAERPLFANWRIGVSVDRSVFALDTAHRSGASIVDARESFGDWSTRLELAWRFPLTVKGPPR
jgi:hypothetical protein